MNPEAAAAEARPANQQGNRLITNVLWSWTGVAASLFQGIIITRYVIRVLGEEHYGIWLQIFSILDYFWFFDLGLNSAVANFCARFMAGNQPRKINEVINTSIFYFSIIGVCAWLISPLLAFNAHRFFPVAPKDQREFATLILITGISWGLGIMLHMFLSALDGLQRFDLTSRVMVAQVALRSIGYFVALKTGHGLVMMAEVYIGTQILGYVLNFLNFRRVFPDLELSTRYIRLGMFRDIFHYGIRSFVANSSTLVLNQSGAVMVGHFLGESAVGFYMLPSRMMQQATDAVSRIGMVTRSNAAEISVTRGRQETVWLGIFSNRYSLTLFMPLAIWLLVYGHDAIERWLGPRMAEKSGPLLPIFLLSYSLVLAGQFNSSSLLFGVGKHGGYARALVLEAVLYLAGLIWVVPRYGIWGTAWVSCLLMIAVRGIYTPWLVSKALEYPLFSYMGGIYIRPLLAAAPVVALAYVLKATILQGWSWSEMIIAGCLITAAYAALGFFICIDPRHRALFVRRIPVLGARLIPHRA